MKLAGAHLTLVATLIAATPAMAEPSVLSSHEIRFRHITFTCGEADEMGTTRRFVYSAPYRINLPMYEPLPGDPASSAWLAAYRTICEKGLGRSQLAIAR